MNKSKIEWCDYTWNPVTGCLHDCPYCYAAKITKRFGGGKAWDRGSCHGENLHVLFTKPETPYPYYFEPTFHKYRLDEPSEIKKPKNIFVCSMADLFGDWVPDEWIKQVFDACKKAPQHRYLFLTKNPKRYYDYLYEREMPDNFWFGTTITNDKTDFFWSNKNKTFISIEPLQSDFKIHQENRLLSDWVIIGAETGNRKGKIIPKLEWIDNIISECGRNNVPIFMKDNLKEICGGLIQEFPW